MLSGSVISEYSETTTVYQPSERELISIAYLLAIVRRFLIRICAGLLESPPLNLVKFSEAQSPS